MMQAPLCFLPSTNEKLAELEIPQEAIILIAKVSKTDA
jgi:hypothetical protein